MSLLSQHHNNPIKQAMLKLRKHRGMNDVLSYLTLLDQETILHKDGALSRHFIYVAPDLTAAMDNELDYHAQTWQKSFNFLGNGWMVETNVISQLLHTHHDAREFPEIVSALIDDERRMQADSDHYFNSTFYLSMTWKPEQLVASKLRRFAIDSDEKDQHDSFDDQCQWFDRVVKDMVGYLGRSLMSIETLRGDALITFLHHCITGDSDKLMTPSVGSFLDTYLAQDFIGGFKPKVGNKHIQVLAVDDVPPQVYPTILDVLSRFPIEYRWASRFIVLDNATAFTYLKRYERNWSSKAIGVLGVIRESLGMSVKLNEDAQAMAEQICAAQNDMASGHVGHGFYNSNIILTHEDEAFLNKMTETIRSHIRRMDFQIREESVNAADAFLGSIPCHGDYNLRKMPVDTEFVSCVLPISSHYLGEAISPCPLSGYKDQPSLLLTTTDGNRSFHLNLHHGDVGHIAILGPTGSGKTTLLQTLIAAHRKYVGSRIMVLDKDYSNRTIVKALQGNYYDLSQHDCQLAPLAHVQPKDVNSINQALEWLAHCCEMQGVSVTPKRQKALREAVLRLAQDKQSYRNLNHLSLQEATLREALQAFNTGNFKKLLNGTEFAFLKTDVIGIDISSLLESDSHVSQLSLPVIKTIFNEFEMAFKDRHPTLLILEEAWLYLQHPLFRARLTDWFKTLRKYNVSVIFISQDLNDIVNSGAASTIQTSCMKRIYLPNASADETQVAKHYHAFGLSDTKIQIIKTAISKRDYYLQSPSGDCLFQLDLGPLTLSFVAISKKADLTQFEKLVKHDDARWVLDWLQYKGLNEWCDFAKQHYFQEVV